MSCTERSEKLSKKLIEVSVVMATVGRYGVALWNAPAELRNDRDVVMAVVQKDGWCLRYASADTAT